MLKVAGEENTSKLLQSKDEEKKSNLEEPFMKQEERELNE